MNYPQVIYLNFMKVDQDLGSSERTYDVFNDGETEIYTESGKTVFANWVQVDPGDTVEIKLVYKTPIKLSTFSMPEKEDSWLDWFTGYAEHPSKFIRMYRLYWQKQSGSWSPEMEITINYPQNWQVYSDKSIDAVSGAGAWSTKAVMKGDSIWSTIFY